jgi:hypothetical protein
MAESRRLYVSALVALAAAIGFLAGAQVQANVAVAPQREAVVIIGDAEPPVLY